MRNGSLQNTLAANAADAITPVVGMGATILWWTDRQAGTIIEVSSSGKSITVQEDNAKRTDDLGMSDCQTYEYTPNTDGSTTVFTLRSNGRFVRKGESMKGGQRVSIGVRAQYHDFSF